MKTPNYIITSVLLLYIIILQTTFAATSSGFKSEYISLWPVVGVERVEKVYPTPHQKTQILYGARLLMGIRLLSLETEYTQSKDNETFVNPNAIVKTTTDKGKVGLNSRINLFSILSWSLRAGAQGKRIKETRSTDTEVTTVNPGIKYAPYAGAGLGIHILNMFSLSATETVIFSKYPSKKNEYETTLGFTVNI